MKVLIGFKEFISRGNVVDLAVAVVIGAAFTALVTSMVEDLLTPIIAAIFGEPDFSALSFTIRGSEFRYGNFLNALIAFLSVAAAVYFFIVAPMNAYKDHLAEDEEATHKECPECLSEIPVAATRCAHLHEPAGPGMSHRINAGEVTAEVYASLHRMSERAESAALAAGFDQKTIELLKMRASQINGCAFCLNLHTKDALELGETTTRLAVLSAWRETEWFTAEEQAALELAEAVTRIADGPLPEDDYERIVSVLGEEKYSAAFWVTIVINSYNRVAITSHAHVGPEAD